MTTNYRYLGYGVTDENGIAHLDHDANGNPIDHSYTGTGAGEIDVVASLDDNTHISDSSIQSETFVVLDTLFYDEATSNAKNQYWFSNRWDNISVSDIGTTIEELSSASINYYISNVANSSTWGDRKLFNTNICVEFEVIEYNTGLKFIIHESDTNYKQLPLNSGSVKLEITNTNIKSTINGNVTNTPCDFTNQVRLGFQTFNDSDLGKITFKDFKVYQI